MAQPLSSPGRSDAFTAPFLPAVQVGAFTGVCGVVVGSAVGIARSQHPVLYSTIAGVQWFAVGSSFYYTRAVCLSSLSRKQQVVPDQFLASGIAGATSGALMGALRSRGNIIPGAIVAGVVGICGQGLVNSIPYYVDSASREPILTRLARSRWIPMKAISDQEYENMLNEKILRIDVEIALIDDKLATLKPLAGKDG